jgi:hypothetical protein
VARRVFLHIGLPKTGTSYLQTILWSHRDELRAAGLLVPGRERRDHLWASLVVRELPEAESRDPRAPQSWDVVKTETAAYDGDVVISHEFFCSASQEQAQRMIEELSPAEVHLVVTARDPLGIFTSSWQESLKNKGTARIENYARKVSDNPRTIWNWRALDLGLVLDRWTTTLPADRVHIITPPPSGAAPDELWVRLCKVMGIDPAVVGEAGRFPNASMGVAEAETLRRVNEQLEGFDKAYDKGVWIRSYLADDRLVTRAGDRYWPDDEQQADCRRRGIAAVELVRSRGFRVVGDLDSLLVPEHVPDRRHPSSVTDAEVAEVAVWLVARLMEDLKARSSKSDRRPRKKSLRGRRR